MSTLATLDEVKALLQWSGATPADAALQRALDAAEAAVLALTGYVTADTAITETWSRPVLGRIYYLRARPVDASTLVVQARAYGGVVSAQLAVDVLDPTQSAVILLGWPYMPWSPTTAIPAPWHQWRAPRWDVVQLTYTARALAPIPPEVRQATAHLAATWYRLGLADPAQSETAGEVRVDYHQRVIPDAILAMLTPHRRRQVWVAA